MIEQIVPGTKTKLKIVKTIYENSGINLTSLIKKVKASPNSVSNYVNNLTNYGVIKEERIGGKKKTHIRNLMPNFASENAKLIFGFVEADKRLLFLKKYKKLKPHFEQLYELLRKTTNLILVYGSYARFAATKESDLDLLIVGKLNKQTKKRFEEIMISLDTEYSLKIETPKKFSENLKKPLYVNILKEHVIIYGEKNFIDFISTG